MLLQFISVLALILSILGNILINCKKRLGFIVWIISNIFWLIVNFIGNTNYSQVLMYIIYVVINADGYLKWKKHEDSKDDCTAFN